MENAFKRAVKTESKLRLALAGPAGSGKTWTMLAILEALHGPGNYAVVDTEHGTAEKYSKTEGDEEGFTFDRINLEAPYHPDRYMKLIDMAVSAGYKGLGVDSLSHAWMGKGGLLELVDESAARMKTPNSYTAWKDVTPIQTGFIDKLTSANLDIVATIRSKQDYVQEKDEGGRTRIRKVGMAPIQRDGMEYEFDVFAEMDTDNRMVIQKTRVSALNGKTFLKPDGVEIAGILKQWLSGTKKEEAPQSVSNEQLEEFAAWVKENSIDRTTVINRSEAVFDRKPSKLTIEELNQLKGELVNGKSNAD